MQLVFIYRRIDWLKVPCGPLSRLPLLSSGLWDLCGLHLVLGLGWRMLGGEGKELKETRPWQAGTMGGDPAQGPHKGRAACAQGLPPGPGHFWAILSSLKSSAVTLQCLKKIKKNYNLKGKPFMHYLHVSGICIIKNN